MRSQPLRNDPLQPHLAGVLEHNGALRVLQVLVQTHPRSALAQDAGERRLAHFDRLAPQVCAVQLQEEVEGIEEGLRLVPPVAKQLEGSHTLVIATHHLAIDQA